MHTHCELILFDPNLVIKLLNINISYNYFDFAGLTFQQIRGTAMGAAFSPTIANIFLSCDPQEIHANPAQPPPSS